MTPYRMIDDDMRLFAPSEDTLTGRNADIYFLRARQIMDAEGIAPWVTVEVFPNGDGMLCGMRETLALLARVLPGDAEVDALSEGAPMQAKEVVLRVRAPYPAFAVYETAILGTLAHESGWATPPGLREGRSARPRHQLRCPPRPSGHRAAHGVRGRCGWMPWLRDAAGRGAGRHSAEWDPSPCPHPVYGRHSDCDPGFRSHH
jgi:hypothetical protein